MFNPTSSNKRVKSRGRRVKGPHTGKVRGPHTTKTDGQLILETNGIYILIVRAGGNGYEIIFFIYHAEI